jgi:hypothetical protein
MNEYLSEIIDYWLGLDGLLPRQRMEGLVFSVLVAIDGEAIIDPPIQDGDMHSRWSRFTKEVRSCEPPS